MEEGQARGVSVSNLEEAVCDWPASLDVTIAVLRCLVGPARDLLRCRLVCKLWMRAIATAAVSGTWRERCDAFLAWEIHTGRYWPVPRVLNVQRVGRCAVPPACLRCC